MDTLPTMLFDSADAWEQWLDENHTTSQGVWLKIAKKASGKVSVAYPEVLDIALCFGWIDGLRRKLDDQYFLQKFTPRRKQSPWSAINREKVTQLIAQGRMREAGLREVQRAQADGRWDVAYQSQARITVPDDLQAALNQNEAAQVFFNQLDSRNRYAILYRIASAKKPETRQKRIATFIDMLAQNKKIYE